MSNPSEGPAGSNSSRVVVAGDFIREQVQRDLAAGRNEGRVQTRFPPEPNGYLHIGHAKSICLNFGAAADAGGVCHLRMDDTNPETEEAEFVDAIEADVRWLGFDPGETRYASDYFEQLVGWAKVLIGAGLAYVDDQNAETISLQRGGYGQPGVDSPFRARTPAENLELFEGMLAGRDPDGARVLRARIDMADPNPQLRDPILYRIRHAHHHRCGDRWVVYPTYDWAHGQSDAIEGTTHSICTLEFDSHRPLYDWLLDRLTELGLVPADGPQAGSPSPSVADSAPTAAASRPRQYEFARLQLTHTVLSKRKLAQLVAEGLVDGWDDPRMPTLRGLRRRGYPPEALRAFCAHIGVAKVNSTHEIELLESFVRDELNRTALRRMAVLRPIKVVVDNYPEDRVEWLGAVNNPEDPAAGSRQVPFGRELYLEAEDFMEVPAPKFYRLSPGSEVRLRYAYFVRCVDVVKDADGVVTELRCTYDPATAGGQAPDGRKVKTTLHWVSAAHAIDAEVRHYNRLFTEAHPDAQEGRDPLEFLDRGAMEVLSGAKLEPALAEVSAYDRVQFERLGYYCADPDQPALFHRTVGLRDEWAKIAKRTR
ncbi:MAG: glutamine--tRNA ligase/YqeY domain fusion protein [Acidimicrobiales bacterium]